MRTALLSVLVAAGCSVSDRVPAGITITCEGPGQCPSGFTCNVTVGVCVETDRADLEPPVVAAVEVRPNLDPTDRTIAYGNDSVVFEVELSVDEELQRDPVVWFDHAERLGLPIIASAAPAYVYEYQPTTDVPEGRYPLSARLVDRAGNVTEGALGATLVVDRTAPRLLTSSARVEYQPAPQNPLVSVNVATDTSTVQVSFATDEPLHPTIATVLRTRSAVDVTFLILERSPISFLFEMVWGASPVDGIYELEVVMTDLATNVVTVELGEVLNLDVTAPATPAVDTEGAVVFHRVPWGSVDVGTDPAFFLSGQPLSIEADAWVIVYADPEGTAEISRVRAGADGSFGGPPSSPTAFELPTSDRAVVYVAAVDAAGNRSDDDPMTAREAAAVRDVDWRVTLNRKRAGDIFDNPHRFLERRFHTDIVEQPDAVELGASDGLSAPLDGLVARTRGTAAWKLVYGPTPRIRSAHAMTYDFNRGRVVLYGGLDTAANFLADTWELVATTWREPVIADPSGDGEPGGRWWSKLAFHEGRGEAVLFGRFSEPDGTLWWFDGARWKSAAYGPGPLAAQFPRGFVYDRGRERLVLMTDDRPVEVWEHDGVQWIHACDATCASASGPSLDGLTSTAAYHEAAGATLVFGAVPGGSELWSWDGQWQQVCPGAGCGGSLPARRFVTASAYDANRSRFVLVGGCTGENTFFLPCLVSGQVYNDAWAWDGSTWSCLSEPAVCNTPDAVPTTAFPAGEIGGGQVTYDPLRDGVVVLPKDGNDAWILRDTTWEPLAVSGAAPLGTLGDVMANEPTSGRTLYFGGSGSNSTFLLDGASWQFQNAMTRPSSRIFGMMARDSTNDLLLLFGGVDPSSSPVRSDGFVFVAGDWVPANVGVATPRYHAAIADNPLSGGLVMHGGGDGPFSYFGDTLRWDPTNGWQDACGACTTSPGALWGASMSYDVANARGVLFGGAGIGAFDSATWLWDGADWSRVDVPGPHGRLFHRSVYDPAREKVYLYGGQIDTELLGMSFVCPSTAKTGCADLWQWDGAGWSLISTADPEGGVDPDAQTKFAFAHENGLSYLVGADSTRMYALDGGADRRPAHAVQIAFGAAAAGAVDFRDVTVVWEGGGTGSVAGTPTSGLQLQVWERNWWRTLASDAALSATNPGRLAWDATGDPSVTPADLDVWMGPEGTVLNLVASPLEPNGTASAFGEVATDYAEVRIRYRRP